MHLVWHRGDLRTHDHPALSAAAQAGACVGLVVLDPTILAAASARRRAWFMSNVEALRASYRRRGGLLLVRDGDPVEIVVDLARRLGAHRVHAIRSYTPYGRDRDQRAQASLGDRLSWYPGQYLQEPGTVIRDDGGSYTVYTPFSKRWWRLGLPTPLASPARLSSAGCTLDPGEIPVLEADVTLPPPGEDAALAALDGFVRNRLHDYLRGRDRLDGSGSSGLSVYINLGMLSPRAAAQRVLAAGGDAAQKWVAELAWRDFAAELLWARPTMLDQPFDPRWTRLQWNADRGSFEAWGAGRTGYPVIDAAMRELAATGLMSNRCRMIVAQFLSKLLLLPWTWGERWFKEQLLDGDTAQNVAGWQWASGLGVDAAPYFRVFNPITQGKEHDPSGAWIKRWVPESHGSAEPMAGAMIDTGEARRRYLELAGEIGRSR